MVGFLKPRSAELRCRICKLMLCCKDCRRKHEERKHLVDPDCDVCIYGKIYITTLQNSSKLLKHLNECHMPMNCVKCKKVYNTVEDINQHGDPCFGMPQKPAMFAEMAIETPLRCVDEAPEYNSPDIDQQHPLNMATSTPMTVNKPQITSPENFTPVESERQQSSKEESKSIQSKSLKKVTFITTPSIENIVRKKKNPENFLKSSLKNSMRFNDSQSTQQSFVTAENITQSRNSVVSPKQLKIVSPVARNKSKRLSQSMNDTLWMSAMNDSLEAEKPNLHSKSHHMSFVTDVSDAGLLHPMQDAGTSYDTSPQKTGVWASVISLCRNVVKTFNHPQLSRTTLNTSLKRTRSMVDSEDERILKRHKLCDVKCRPPIRRGVIRVDASIQTDFFEEN